MIPEPSPGRGILVAAALLLASACTRDVAGPGNGMRPPYLAIVVAVDAPAEVTNRGPYSFRIRELSGTLPVDTTLRASPSDTIILHVEPASYRVDIADVPPTCGVRDGMIKSVTVPPNTNTSLVRFFISCTPALTVSALTEGMQPDSGFILTVKGAVGAERVTLLAANDTVRLDDLPAGAYSVTLRHIASNCLVTSDGGDNVTASISASGGAFVPFRVVCSEANLRPRIASLAATYANGSIAFYMRAADPDKDIERTFVDITNCNRKSILPGGGRLRAGFRGFPNVTLRDTAEILGAFDLSVTDAALAGRCIAAWVADERGNISEFVEQPITMRSATHSPVAPSANARYNGTRGLQIALSPSDPDGDYVGLFFVYIIRDGIVSLPGDGVADRLLSHPAGIIGAIIPELPFGIGFGVWNDYLGTIIYLVDRAGNFTRIEDNDLNR